MIQLWVSATSVNGRSVQNETRGKTDYLHKFCLGHHQSSVHNGAFILPPSPSAPFTIYDLFLFSSPYTHLNAVYARSIVIPAILSPTLQARSPNYGQPSVIRLELVVHPTRIVAAASTRDARRGGRPSGS